MIGAALPNMLAGLTAGLANILPTTPSATITVLSAPSMTPITNALPDIPRSYTAICEWAACMVYIAVLYRRVPLQRSIIVSAAGLLLLTAVQYFDGSMPIWFWIIGMLLAFACMYATILLGVILTAKERACADRGITFTAVADGSLLSGMSSMDIASLFGNALDNAIEATSKLPKHEQRLIKLALYEQNHFIVIRVENYYDSRLKKDAEGNLRTTKRDDQHRHGFGVKSIRHIAQQYGGEVTIRTEDHWFVLTALIPKKTGLMAI